MKKIEIECSNPGKISDGFHTFDELYAHRIILFMCLMKFNKLISWKSKKQNDGSSEEGWFLVGMDLPNGQVSYHIPERFWDDLIDIPEKETAPFFDGYSSVDVLKRLKEWCAKI